MHQVSYLLSKFILSIKNNIGKRIDQNLSVMPLFDAIKASRHNMYQIPFSTPLIPVYLLSQLEQPSMELRELTFSLRSRISRLYYFIIVLSKSLLTFSYKDFKHPSLCQSVSFLFWTKWVFSFFPNTPTHIWVNCSKCSRFFLGVSRLKSLGPLCFLTMFLLNLSPGTKVQPWCPL